MKEILFPVLIFLLACGSASGRQKPAASDKASGKALVIRGQVTGLEVERTATDVRFYVKLNVTFANTGPTPIILFSPSVQDDSDKIRYWLGGWALFGSESEANSVAGKPLFADDYWESVAGSEYYKKLAAQLDVGAPPSDFTKILASGESWQIKDDFRIYFEKETHQRFPLQLNWKEMQAYPSRLWLSITYELNPWNVEFFAPHLIRRLQKRWQKYGTVLQDPANHDRFDLLRYDSAPMLIDLEQAQVRVSSPNP